MAHEIEFYERILLPVIPSRIIVPWSNKAFVPNTTEDLNLSVFNMIREINGLKILTKHMSCEFKCKVHNGKCNSHQKWINDKCRYKSKN